jgi:serine/threonine protein kinase
MVTFDPANRLTVLEALKHPYLEAYHDEDDEPECETKYENWKEIEKLETVDQYRTAIWNEVEEFRREVREMVVGPETPEPVTENGAEVTSEGAEKPTMGPTVTVESPGGPKPTLEGDITDEPTNFLSDPEAIPAGPVPFPSSGRNSPSPSPAAASVPLPRQRPGSRTKSSVDPYEIYARRSVVLPPSPQALTGSLPPGGIDPKDPAPIDQQLSASYIVPARSRAASAADGTIGPGGFTGNFPRLLRTLSTLSVNDSGAAGAAMAALGRIEDDKTSMSAADAPPSSIPLEFRPKKREG